MKTGVFDKYGIEICEGDLVELTTYLCKSCNKVNPHKETYKIKLEYGGFYLVYPNEDPDEETIYDQTYESTTLSDLCMRHSDHGDGYTYNSPIKQIQDLEIVERNR